MIKNLLKRITSLSQRRIIRRWIFLLFRFDLDKKFRGAKNSEIFDEIQCNGACGELDNGVYMSGIGSHTEEIIRPYINTIIELLSNIRPSIVVVIGCGDFNIGKNFVRLNEKYIACDISSIILERSKEKISFTKEN